MKENLDVVRGSGRVFCDLRHENADAEQFKAILAAEIIKTLDRERLTVRAAHNCTGIAAADFSRIRGTDLGRFTVDRLMRNGFSWIVSGRRRFVAETVGNWESAGMWRRDRDFPTAEL